MVWPVIDELPGRRQHLAFVAIIAERRAARGERPANARPAPLVIGRRFRGPRGLGYGDAAAEPVIGECRRSVHAGLEDAGQPVFRVVRIAVQAVRHEVAVGVVGVAHGADGGRGQTTVPELSNAATNSGKGPGKASHSGRGETNRVRNLLSSPPPLRRWRNLPALVRRPGRDRVRPVERGLVGPHGTAVVGAMSSCNLPRYVLSMFSAVRARRQKYSRRRTPRAGRRGRGISRFADKALKTLIWKGNE